MKLKNILLILALLFLVSCNLQPEYETPAATQNQIKNVDALKNGDTSSVETSEVDYGSAIGFLAQPKEAGVYPAVVMIHEWWGLNDNIKEMAKQLAAEGYVVLAVDLYNGKVGKNSSEAGELAAKVRNNLPNAITNMKSAVKFLKNQNKVNKNKIASFKRGSSSSIITQTSLGSTPSY